MSDTIQKIIRDVAMTCRENPTKEAPELTAKDFLAELALNKSMSKPECEMRCMFAQHDSYKKDPDNLIDRELGFSGSAERARYEDQANALLRVAQKYKGSPDLDRPDHSYRLEVKAAEASFQYRTNTEAVKSRNMEDDLRETGKTRFEP